MFILEVLFSLLDSFLVSLNRGTNAVPRLRRASSSIHAGGAQAIWALSGGQQQRVSIARSLAMTPDLLITDEPTSMLDLPIRMGLLRTLNRIREERGMSILFVSHDLAAARYFSDRILVMQHGEIVERGDTEEVTQSPKHPYTKRLLHAASRPKIDP